MIFPMHGKEWCLVEFTWVEGLGLFIYENRRTGKLVEVVREQ